MTNFKIKSEIIKQIISDYNYNEKINKPHGAKINMTYNRNNKENNNENNEEPAAWISRTKSGKGFVIVLEEGTPKNTVFVGSLSLMDKFIDEKILGVPLSVIEK